MPSPRPRPWRRRRPAAPSHGEAHGAFGAVSARCASGAGASAAGMAHDHRCALGEAEPEGVGASRARSRPRCWKREALGARRRRRPRRAAGGDDRQAGALATGPAVPRREALGPCARRTRAARWEPRSPPSRRRSAAGSAAARRRWTRRSVGRQRGSSWRPAAPRSASSGTTPVGGGSERPQALHASLEVRVVPSFSSVDRRGQNHVRPTRSAFGKSAITTTDSQRCSAPRQRSALGPARAAGRRRRARTSIWSVPASARREHRRRSRRGSRAARSPRSFGASGSGEHAAGLVREAARVRASAAAAATAAAVGDDQHRALGSGQPVDDRVGAVDQTPGAVSMRSLATQIELRPPPRPTSSEARAAADALRTRSSSTPAAIAELARRRRSRSGRPRRGRRCVARVGVEQLPRAVPLPTSAPPPAACDDLAPRRRPPRSTARRTRPPRPTPARAGSRSGAACVRRSRRAASPRHRRRGRDRLARAVRRSGRPRARGRTRSAPCRRASPRRHRADRATARAGPGPRASWPRCCSRSGRGRRPSGRCRSPTAAP